MTLVISLALALGLAAGCATGSASFQDTSVKEGDESAPQDEETTEETDEKKDRREASSEDGASNGWGIFESEPEVAQSSKVVLTQDQWEHFKRLVEVGPVPEAGGVSVAEVVVHHLAGLPADVAATITVGHWDIEPSQTPGKMPGALVWTTGSDEDREEHSVVFMVFYEEDRLAPADETARRMVKQTKALAIPDDVSARPPMSSADGGDRLRDRWSDEMAVKLTGDRSGAIIFGFWTPCWAGTNSWRS